MAQGHVLPIANTIMVNSPNTEFFVHIPILSNEKNNSCLTQSKGRKKLPLVKLLFKKIILIYSPCMQCLSLFPFPERDIESLAAHVYF